MCVNVYWEEVVRNTTNTWLNSQKQSNLAGKLQNWLQIPHSLTTQALCDQTESDNVNTSVVNAMWFLVKKKHCSIVYYIYYYYIFCYFLLCLCLSYKIACIQIEAALFCTVWYLSVYWRIYGNNISNSENFSICKISMVTTSN